MDTAVTSDGTEVVNVGVVGAGAMGAAHIRTLTDWVPAARVVSVYDADLRRAKELASEVGAEAGSSADAVIGSDCVDAVIIAAPDRLHEELVLTALTAGKPALCEKPLATNVEASRRIVEAEVAHGSALIRVGFMRRFDPGYVELRRIVTARQIGRPRVMHCVHRNAYAHHEATSDGVIVNSMVHELDIVPWLLDDPLAAITVAAPNVPGGQLLDPQVALLDTRGGSVVTVEVFVNAGYGYDVRCEVVGDAGTARLTPPYGVSLRRDGSDGLMVSDDFVKRFTDAYRLELAAWIGGIRTGEVNGPTAWDGHRANVAAAAGVESLRSGRRVEIPLEDMPELYR